VSPMPGRKSRIIREYLERGDMHQKQGRHPELHQHKDQGERKPGQYHGGREGKINPRKELPFPGSIDLSRGTYVGFRTRESSS